MLDIKTKKAEGPEAPVPAPGADYCARCEHSHFRAYSTPLSILAGAVLISMSILFSSGIFNPSIGGQANTNPTPGTAAGAQEDNRPVTVNERKDAPVLGNPNAPVTLVEFSDFQCPFCQRFFSQSYQQLKAKYVDTGKVKVVFRHFPLPIHQNAEKAAEAGECAARQGKFEAYHDTLFTKGQADGTGLALADLKTYASDLGLDVGRFNACLDNGEAAAAVAQDFRDGQVAGVNGTPSFVLNGEKIVGAQPTDIFDQALAKATAGK